MMKFASGFAALAAASECGPKVVIDGHFPVESRAVYHTYTEVDYADHFDITYASTFKVLNNFDAKEQYVLTMCDNDAPDDATADAASALPEGFTRKHFTVPLASYGSDSTATLAFLDIINVHDRQKYISEYATAPCLQKAMGCDDTMKAASAWGDDAEKAKRIEQIGEVAGFFVDGASELPNTIAVATHLDPHLLNRAEWVKFVAAFFNREDLAEQHMQAELSAWEALTADAAAMEATPKTAFVDNAAWNNQYIISFAPYKALLIQAAGGTTFTADDFSGDAHAVVGWDGNSVAWNASNPDAVAAFRAALANVDVLIDETYAWDPQSYTASSFSAGYGADFAPARIFRVDGKLGGLAGNGLDWFEGSFARPAQVLTDFVAAMHDTGDAMVYLRTLDGTPTVMTAEDCAYKIPVCDGEGAAAIESPCDRYQVCEVEVPTTSAPATSAPGDESASVAAAFLIVAAAFA